MTELEKLCREAYGAYEFLRENDLAEESGTSRRLRAGDLGKLRARLAEELAELKGVIEGTHFHEGFDRDILLEGYEVWYWAANLVVAQHYSYDQIRPEAALQAGFKASPAQREAELGSIFNVIERIRSEPPGQAAGLVKETLRIVGMACALNNTSPVRLLERDTAEMRQKSYLAGYWQSLDSQVGPVDQL